MTKQTKVQNGFVTVEARTLRAALVPLSYVTQKKNMYPILACVRLEYSGSSLRLTGTDLDIELSVTIDVIDGDQDWGICVDLHRLLAIAKVSGVEPLKLACMITPPKDDKTPHLSLEITAADDTRYEMNGNLPATFPTIKGTRRGKIEAFTQGSMASEMGRVRSFISTEETRYYLNGIYWHMVEDGRYFVATDGHRIGVLRYAPDGLNDTKVKTGRIIPHKTVGLICKHFSHADMVVYHVEHGDDKQPSPRIDIVAGAWTLRFKLIDGNYPDYHRVIPDPDKVTLRLTVPKLQLTAALAKFDAFCNRSCVRFVRDKGRVCLGGKTTEHEEMKTFVAGDWPSDVGVQEFGLNSSFLGDIIATCEGDVTLKITDADGPVIIADMDANFTRVQMPMRV